MSTFPTPPVDVLGLNRSLLRGAEPERTPLRYAWDYYAARWVAWVSAAPYWLRRLLGRW